MGCGMAQRTWLQVPVSCHHVRSRETLWKCSICAAVAAEGRVEVPQGCRGAHVRAGGAAEERWPWHGPSAGAAQQRGTAVPIAAELADGFYKRSSKYLGMPNISAATRIPARVLFMKRCLNSEGNVLSIKCFSPASSSHRGALFCLQTSARSHALHAGWGGTAELQSPSVPLSGLRGLQTISLW